MDKHIHYSFCCVWVYARHRFVLKVTGFILIKHFAAKDEAFSFAAVEKGVCLLTISSQDFDKQVFSLDVNVDKVLRVSLGTSAENLYEVKISSPKQVFFNYNGNIKVNVENSVLAIVALG